MGPLREVWWLATQETTADDDLPVYACTAPLVPGGARGGLTGRRRRLAVAGTALVAALGALVGFTVLRPAVAPALPSDVVATPVQAGQWLVSCGSSIEVLGRVARDLAFDLGCRVLDREPQSAACRGAGGVAPRNGDLSVGALGSFRVGSGGRLEELVLRGCANDLAWRWEAVSTPP